MDPGYCVEEVVRSIAIQGSHGASIPQIWDFARAAANQDLSELLKTLVWKWTSRHADIVVKRGPDNEIERSQIENLSLSEIETKYGPDLRLYANETRQWRELADRTPGSIGTYPWEVLCAAARAGSAGISAIDIRNDTGQDARSIHGRVALLVEMGLVARYPTVVNGANTSLIVFFRFDKHKTESATRATVSKDGWNPQEVSKRLVDLCKSGPNGIRLTQDLVDELGFTKVQRGLPLFRSMVKRLVALGAVRKVDMYEASDPSAFYRCIQYIKDLPSSQAANSTEDDDSDDDDDELADDVAETRPRSTNMDIGNMILVDSATPVPSANLSANLYYSLATQVYDVVAKAGSAGITAMEIHRTVAGQQYTKVMGRILDSLSLPKHQKGPYGHLSLVRAVDFEGRTKFYRYFTRAVYSQRQGEAYPSEWGTFSKAASKATSSIATLENKSHGPLPGYTGIVDEGNGEQYAHFHGDTSKPFDSYIIASTEAVGSRGRPRKSDTPSDTKPRPRQTMRFTATAVGDRVWEGGTPASSGHVAKVLSSEPATPADAAEVPNREITATKPKQSTPVQSLAREKRQGWVLELLKENGGVLEGGHNLQKLLNTRFSQETQLDRRTVNGAVNALVASAAIKQLTVAVPGNAARKLLVLENAGVNDQAIEDAKVAIRDHAQQKKAGFSAQSAPTLEGEISLLSETKAKPHRYKVLTTGMAGASAKKQRKKQGPSATDLMGTSAAAVSEPPKKRGRRRAVRTPTPLETVDEVPEPASRRTELVDPALMLPRSLSQLPPLPAETYIPPGLLGDNDNDNDDDHDTRSTDTPPTETSRRTTRPATEIEDVADSVGRVDAERLMKLVVIGRVLYGRGTAIDWPLIATGLEGIPPAQAQKKWPTVRDSLGGTKRIAALSEQFAQLFESAYTIGDIKRHDPQSHDFSLGFYLDWWIDNAANPRYNADEEVLTTREDYEKAHGPIRTIGRSSDPLEHAQSMPSMIKLEELLLVTPFGLRAVQPVPETQFTPIDMRVRAVIAADDDTYDPVEAAAELESIPEADAAASLERLVSKKFATSVQRDPGKHKPGRLYTLSDRAQTLIASKLAITTPPESTELAKTWFTHEYKVVPETVNESLLIPLFEGVSRFETLDLKRVSNKAGRLSSHYRSRMISKDMLDGKVEVRLKPGVEAVIPGHNLPVIPIPSSQAKDAPYIWQTTRLASKHIWQALILKIVTTVLFRPGITQASVVNHLLLALAPVEVDALISWLIEHGNLTATDAGLFASPQWFISLY